jgi:DNA (cytosine-5)-methyltransferase 1
MRLLPTPWASEAAKGGPNQRGSSGDLTLTSSVMLLPAPTAADRWGQYAAAIRRWETILGRPAPEPTVTGKRGGQRLSGRFTEWLMGLPDGWVSDLVDNNAAVRICGNGVVPQQAIAAYGCLLAHPRQETP